MKEEECMYTNSTRNELGQPVGFIRLTDNMCLMVCCFCESLKEFSEMLSLLNHLKSSHGSRLDSETFKKSAIYNEEEFIYESNSETNKNVTKHHEYFDDISSQLIKNKTSSKNTVLGDYQQNFPKKFRNQNLFVKCDKNYNKSFNAVEIHSKQFYCGNCKSNFQLEKELLEHICSYDASKSEISVPETSFHPETDSTTLDSKRNLDVHIRRHTKERTHKCPYCARSFYTSHALKTHRTTHEHERVHKCEYCYKCFRSIPSVWRHIKYNHPNHLSASENRKERTINKRHVNQQTKHKTDEIESKESHCNHCNSDCQPDDEKGEIIQDLLVLTEEAVLTSDFNNPKDLKIVASLLECIEMATALPSKRKREEWVKPWREQGNKRSFSFLSKELSCKESSFFNYLGINEQTFNYILAAIECDIRRNNILMREAIPPAEKLAVTLRYLATGESYKSTEYQSRLSESFLSRAIPEVCAAIWKHFQKEYLQIPTTKKEWEDIAEDFDIKRQFPHCLGAMAGKHISLKSLRKETKSIVLLALVDANCRFIYINVGLNGQTNKADVFMQSDLKAIIDDAETHFPSDKILGNGRKLPYVIVADDAFTLQKHILKTYSYNINLKERKIFNIRLLRAKHVVEHAFEILSNRFRILQTNLNLSDEKVELITKTCCVLHNLLSHKAENYLSSAKLEVPLERNTSTREPNEYAKGAGQTIRQGFADYFNNEGKLDLQENKL